MQLKALDNGIDVLEDAAVFKMGVDTPNILHTAPRLGEVRVINHQAGIVRLMVTSDDDMHHGDEKLPCPLLPLSPDEIGPDGLFFLGVAVNGDIEPFDHPCHVAPQGAHGLHAFLVECHLSRGLAVNDVPVLRTDHGHVHHAEVVVQAVEGGRRTATAAHHHTGGWLILQLLAQ